MRASSAICHGKEDWVEEVHSGSRVVTSIGRISVAVGLGLGRLVDDHMSTRIVSPQESPDHRLVAVLSWIVVVIVKGTSVHESINEK